MSSNDIKYWGAFYSNYNNIECSDFCNFIIDYFKQKNIFHENSVNVLDCGCGNGRDSYVLSTRYNVTAVDNSGFLPKDQNNLKFLTDDFVTINKNGYDLIYSCFTFHSITNDQHTAFLNTINANSYLVIETRSKKGENDDVFHGKTHYRNYTDIDYLKNVLTLKKFEIILIMEDLNFAKYKNENPILL